MAKTFTASITFDLNDIDKDDLLQFVAYNFTPEDVFPVGELQQWADDNGYVQGPN